MSSRDAQDAAHEHATYKAAKEAWVADLSGTTITELRLLCLVMPVGVWMMRAVLARFDNGRMPSRVAQVAFEWAVVVLPSLVAFTATWLALPTMVTMGLVAFGLYAGRMHGEWQEQFKPGERVPELTAYRSLMMLATVIAILAVDFPIYPRRLAKTETFGTGLMDLGVGSFLLSSALASRTARLGDARQPVLRRFARACVSAAPMLVLGIVRMALVKGVDYQEHVSEYGVHWNFFFSIGIVAVAVQTLSLPPRTGGMVGAVLLLAYQVWLLALGGTEYIMDAPRVDFVSANREGFASSVGNVALYLIGTYAGAQLVHMPRITGASVRSMTLRLIVVGEVCFALAWAADAFVQPVSRRMVNVAYVAWVLGHNLWLLGLVMASRTIAPSAGTMGIVLTAINDNSLLVFLAANLLTGAVNLSMKTLYASDTTSYAVMCAYLSAVVAVAVLLPRRMLNKLKRG